MIKFKNNIILFFIFYLFLIISIYNNICYGYYENSPPDHIRNIKNENGSKLLKLELPVVAVPYSPVLITVSGLEDNVDLNNITIYIGKMECINISYFNITTISNIINKENLKQSYNQDDHLYDDPSNVVLDESPNYKIDEEFGETISYLESIVTRAQAAKAKTLRCDLRMVNISVNYLQAQDVYIVVDKTLTVTHNCFTFRDITPCPGSKLECNGGGTCFAGVCLCESDVNTGPQCNLQSSTPQFPELNELKPQIIYTNGLAKWMISFETLSIAEKVAEDTRTMLFQPIADLLYWNWTLKEADQQSGISGSEIGVYNLTLPNGIVITINVLYYKNLTYDRFFDTQFINLFYHKGDLRIFFTISNIPIELRKRFAFQLVLYVYTFMEESECSYIDSDFDIDFGKGFDYDDVRWAYIRNKDYALYTRLFGKCIMDGKPQSCIVDINELSRRNYEGNLKLLAYFEPFSTNVSIHHDFGILLNTKNPNSTQVSCDKYEPIEQPLKWLIPTIVPLIFIGLICFILIIIYLFKANRKNLEFNTKYYFNNFTNNENNNKSKKDRLNGASPTIITSIKANDSDDDDNLNNLNNNNINNDNQDNNNINNNNSNNNNNNSFSDSDSFEESIFNINKITAKKRF